MNTEQEMNAWRAWREACAFGLIGEKERIGLQKVVGDRFRSRVKRLNAYGAGLPRPEDTVCAHLFESWCALHQRRDGKRYKDWLLSRGRRDLDTVQSGVMMMVRNVVREWVKEFHAQVAELSVDDPLPEAGGLTLSELLPQQTPEASDEQDLWRQCRAASMLQEADDVEKTVLRLRAEGAVFSHPQVNADTGYGKTTLHKYHRRLLEKMADEVKKDFPGLAPSDASSLVLETLDQAGQEILSKKSAEK